MVLPADVKLFEVLLVMVAISFEPLGVLPESFFPPPVKSFHVSVTQSSAFCAPSFAEFIKSSAFDLKL